MSKARTVPGESLSSRLAARSGSRARIGPQRSFYQRLGVSDPYGEDPEVEEIARSGMYSFLSAANYYREIRSSRLRMMWRLGAIRHRAVAGERLRAAGPSFAAQRTLAGASLPNVSELVLIDPDARPEGEEELDAPVRRRRSETPRRRRVAATRAVERSVGRPDGELIRALAQIESLVKGRSRQAIQAVQRDLPNVEAPRRAEVIRELVRTVEREVVREAAAPVQTRPAAIERLAERVSSPAPVEAQRPLSVAAQRGRSVEAPLPGRRASAPLFDGPTGLEPVLRSSPAIQAAIAVERAGRRPEAIERLAATTRTRQATRSLTAPERVEISHTPAELVDEASPVQARRPRATEPRRRRGAPRAVEPDGSAPVAERPTARMARVGATQPVAARVQPEVFETARGPRAISRRVGAPAGALPRALMRSRVGHVAQGEPAPLATAATSWLSEASHPERALRRVAPPRAMARSLAVAGEMPLLQPDVAEAAPVEPAPRPPRRNEERPARVIRAADQPDVPTPRVRATRSVEVDRSTLRAVGRSERDQTRLAPSPVARRRVARTAAAEAAVLLAPQEVEAEGSADTRLPRRRTAARADGPTRVDRTPDASGEARPAIRVARRLERAEPESVATAPILDRVIDEPVERAQRSSQRRATRPVALDLVSLNPTSVADEAAEPARVRRRTSAPRGVTPARSRAARAERSTDRAPATRRAMHRAVEAAEVAPTRRPLTAAPTSFVDPVLSQRALQSDDSEGAEVPRPRPERAMTRAAARSVRTARVDRQDRVRLVPSVTDYLDVAAGAEELAGPPIRRVRPSSLPRPDAQVIAHPEAPSVESAIPARRRVPTARVAQRARPARRRLDLNETHDVAVRPHAPRAPALPATELRDLARRLARGEESPVQTPVARAAARVDQPATISERQPAGVDEGPVAGAARRLARPVVAVQDLALPQPLGVEAAEAETGVATRRRDLPPLTESLRQVAGTFRAAERDQVHVVSIDAARRAVTPTAQRSPTIEAILERDEGGRIVQVRGRRLTGRGAGETVTLDPASFGATPSTETTTRPVTRATDRAEAAQAEETPRRRRVLSTAPAPSVLAHSPAEWAEERAEASAPMARPRHAQAVSSPVHRAGQRWTRPIPEGPVLERWQPAAEPAAAHRLTAPMARGGDFDGPAPVRGVGRTRGPRPGTPEPTYFEGPQTEETPEIAAAPGRRRAHSVNTWTELPGRRDASDRSAPSWVRRAVEPAKADRPERETIGSKVRAGGGLLTALSRASDPEEIVRVILQRGHDASALARELPGEAGNILTTIASTPQSALDEPTVVPSRHNRGETKPSLTSRRARTEWLNAGPEASGTWRTRSGSGSASEGGEGVGASSVMKLASKLKKLIHLAEHARRDEARSAVRMSEDTGEARQDVGAGKAGGQALEEDNMHIERLREEVLREVQHMLEMNKMRSIGDGDGQW